MSNIMITATELHNYEKEAKKLPRKLLTPDCITGYTPTYNIVEKE